MAADADLILMDSARVSRSLRRMAHEIVEQNIKDKAVILFGIDTRGFAVANFLADTLSTMLDNVISFRLPREEEDGQVFNEAEATGIDDSFIIVVDDVIFSGQTMFNALKKISERIQPNEIHTAVLVDRGHRKFPVQAEFFGMELPTKLNEHVSVVVDDGEIQQVLLVNPKD